MTTDEKVMRSLAHWLMLEKCRDVNINPSGTYCEQAKNTNGKRVFRLIKQGDINHIVMEVVLKASNAPRFSTHEVIA